MSQGIFSFTGCACHCCFVCVIDTDIDHPHVVSPLQVEEDRSFIEVSQHGHVLYHVELRRVHGLEVIFFYYQKLKHRSLTL